MAAGRALKIVEAWSVSEGVVGEHGNDGEASFMHSPQRRKLNGCLSTSHEMISLLSHSAGAGTCTANRVPSSRQPASTADQLR